MRITLVGSRHFGVTTLNMLRQHGVEIAGVVVADAEDRLAAAARDAGALAVAHVDLTSLGVLEAPGAYGCDMAIGEGQSIGNAQSYGGPHYGFLASRTAFIRRLPGRIVGQTTDLNGDRGFVLTLQTREQHIRREKATSNICTAQALNALGGVVYLTWLGREGLVELGELLLQRTHYAREALCAIDGVEPLHTQPVIREFAVTLPRPVDEVVEHCAARGVNPGLALHEHDALLVAITEGRSRADIDRLADVVAEAVAA
ncbi:MAG: glycine dehydrogenase subunit 1 [Solirubrobacteraceae bacterium]|nr:glycine dehydrogenase subunit 1 [Solirubrobacteraceae bacterium]